MANHQDTAPVGADFRNILQGPPRDRLLRLSEVSPQSVPWLPATPVPTLQRWAKAGVRGHVLKTVLLAGIKHTSSDWLWEFVEAVTNGSTVTPILRRTHTQRERARARAAVELTNAGI